MKHPSLMFRSLCLIAMPGCFFILMVDGFAPPLRHRSIARTYGGCSLCRYATSSEEKDGQEPEQQQFLEKARALRDEAQQLETTLRETKPKSSVDVPTILKPPLKITDLKDSIWVLSYRFSSQPKDDNENDNNTIILPNYSGKVTLRLKEDGYSELLSLADDKLQIPKIWGWDEEYSSDDEQEYLLFSMDVKIPKSDPSKLSDQTERFYFQARIDKDEADGAIVLQDGTVTVKKDVAEKTKGMWGLFKVAGILTEFRYVGDFVAKPSSES
jgi:hypothetical protein